MDQQKIGHFIASCRKEKKLTQAQLAEKLGVTNRTISKWENGRGLPDLSLFSPLSQELGITINELLSGEKLNRQNYPSKLEENMVRTLKYSQQKITDKNKALGFILLFFGLLLILIAISIFPSESNFSIGYTLLGIIITLVGIRKLTKQYTLIKSALISVSFLILIISLLLFLDFVNVVKNQQAPRFCYLKETINNTTVYHTPFYRVFRINKDTNSEYYFIDTKKEHTLKTIPRSPFNRNKSGIKKIIQYQNKYVGNNSNDGNLINALPLSEYGYVFQIDTSKLELIIDYHITDWYITDNLYLQRALLYNSVSIFALIANTQAITYNFSGNHYHIEKKTLQTKYPHYEDICKNQKINQNNFNHYLEEKLNDPQFVTKTFTELFKG